MMKEERIDWLQDRYWCEKCNESIFLAFTVDKENNLWLKMVLEFSEKHHDHGFTL